MQLLIFSEWMKEKITLKKEKHCLRGEKNESDFPLININRHAELRTESSSDHG